MPVGITLAKVIVDRKWTYISVDQSRNFLYQLFLFFLDGLNAKRLVADFIRLLWRRLIGCRTSVSS
jgi:hypothetical protein